MMQLKIINRRTLKLIFFCFVLSVKTIAQTSSSKNELSQKSIDSLRRALVGISGPGKPAIGLTERGKGNGPSFDTVNGPINDFGLVVRNGMLPNLKPLWNVHIRDAKVRIGGDGYYYLTGSTGEDVFYYNTAVEIYRSKDLKKWEYLGVVWDIDKDGGWEKNTWGTMPYSNGKPVRAIWSPEIHFINNNYYICLSMSGGGISILKSTTGMAQGPYRHTHNPEVPLQKTGIAPTLFKDEDGSVYLIYNNGKIGRLNAALSGLEDSLHTIELSTPDLNPSLHNPKFCKSLFQYKDLGYEGATLFKRNGKYYFAVTDRYQGRYSLCIATSESIYGPYRNRYEPVPCNGSGNFFKAKDGYWYSSLFGDDRQAPFRSMPGIVRIDFTPDGKVIVAKKQPSFILAE